jgi:hypothetical protein
MGDAGAEGVHLGMAAGYGTPPKPGELRLGGPVPTAVAYAIGVTSVSHVAADQIAFTRLRGRLRECVVSHTPGGQRIDAECNVNVSINANGEVLGVHAAGPCVLPRETVACIHATMRGMEFSTAPAHTVSVAIRITPTSSTETAAIK